MTTEEFERALEGFGETLGNLSPVLFDLGGQIVDEMKRNVPQDTGNLKSSIKAVIDEDSLSFQMLAYGLFQNFGVKPDYNTSSKHKPFNSRFGGIQNPQEVPFGVEPQPLSGNFYTYKTRKFGLPQRKFFDVDDIATIIADGVAQQLTTDF
tara:strand:+ start:113 stop:565 length:453 start_codon:yes stop_codon:yes gene_type:complete